MGKKVAVERQRLLDYVARLRFDGFVVSVASSRKSCDSVFGAEGSSPASSICPTASGSTSF